MAFSAQQPDRQAPNYSGAVGPCCITGEASQSQCMLCIRLILRLAWKKADLPSRRRAGMLQLIGDMLGDAVHVCCSWLGKIQTVKELLVDSAERNRPGLDALAYAYIYLQVALPDQPLLYCLVVIQNHVRPCHD